MTGLLASAMGPNKGRQKPQQAPDATFTQDSDYKTPYAPDKGKQGRNTQPSTTSWTQPANNQPSSQGHLNWSNDWLQSDNRQDAWSKMNDHHWSAMQTGRSQGWTPDQYHQMNLRFKSDKEALNNQFGSAYAPDKGTPGRNTATDSVTYNGDTGTVTAENAGNTDYSFTGGTDNTVPMNGLLATTAQSGTGWHGQPTNILTDRGLHGPMINADRSNNWMLGGQEIGGQDVNSAVRDLRMAVLQGEDKVFGTPEFRDYRQLRAYDKAAKLMRENPDWKDRIRTEQSIVALSELAGLGTGDPANKPWIRWYMENYPNWQQNVEKFRNLYSQQMNQNKANNLRHQNFEAPSWI